VVYSVHADYWISIDGNKGTQSLYLRQTDQEGGELIYIIPFVQRAGLMTFDHWKPVMLDDERNLPIVMLTMDIKWDLHNHHDDHGKVVIEKLGANLIAGHSEISLQEHIASDQANLSAWNHGETCSVFALHGEAEDTFHDALQGTRKEFYGKAFHLAIPPHCSQNSPYIHFLRKYDGAEFLGTLCCHELLGFLSYILALRTANVFRSFCEDPTAFFTDGQLWYDPQSDTTKCGIRALLHWYITAYGELATLDVKHESENCKENMLKKQLCESTENLVDLVHANMLKN
jgi:hypothetical protein